MIKINHSRSTCALNIKRYEAVSVLPSISENLLFTSGKYAILRSMSIDWTEMYREYKGKWVAIDSEDERTVVTAGEDAKKVYAESQRAGKRAILHRVPEEVIDFAGYEV